MHRSPYEVLNAKVAGFTAALFLVIGRWSPERLFGIESPRYYELNPSMLIEPRQWVLPVLVISVCFLRFRPKRPAKTRRDFVASRYGQSAFRYLVLLYVYLICSATWTPEAGFGTLKAYDAFLSLSVLVTIGLWHRSTESELFHQAFWKSIVSLTGILMVCALISLGAGRLAVLGGGPNVFARLMFLFAAGCMGMSQQRRFYEPVLAMVAMALVVLSGSRGGMLAAAFGGAVYIAAERTKISSKVLLVSGAMAAGTMILFLTPLGQRVYVTFSERIVQLTIKEGYTSDRDVLVEEALGIWKEYPIFGTGLSGWAAIQHQSSETVSSHPHNLFCEMLCEGGLIAASLLALTIGCFLRYAQLLRWRLHIPSFACAAMYLMASQFSGDFFDSRGVFVCALLSTFPYSVKEENSAITRKRASQARSPSLPPSPRRSHSPLAGNNRKVVQRGRR